MQFIGPPPKHNSKIYFRSKIIRYWFSEDGYHNKSILTDLEGNFNLMSAEERALGLLTKIIIKDR